MRIFQSNQGDGKWPITDLRFSPDSSQLAVNGEFSSLEFWDVASGDVRYGPYFYTPHAECMRFDAKGRWLYVADFLDGFRAIDVRRPSAETLIGGRLRPNNIVVSGKCCVLFSETKFVAYTLTAKGIGEQQWSKKLPECFDGGMDGFPDGKTFAVIEPELVTYTRAQTYLCTRSLADGALLSKVRCACKNPGQLAISPDGTLAAMREKKGISVYRVADCAPVGSWQRSERGDLTSMTFHPGGRFIATTCNDTTVQFHDRDAGWDVTKTFTWDVGKLAVVAFSPDGCLAAAAGKGRKVVVWDIDA
jgi:WD40 repeat protein